MIHQGPDVPPPIIIMITLSIKYFIESSKLTDDTVLLQDRQRTTGFLRALKSTITSSEKNV